MTELTSMQREAIQYVSEQSRKQSDAAYPALKARVERLGLHELDLRKTIRCELVVPSCVRFTRLTAFCIWRLFAARIFWLSV